MNWSSKKIEDCLMDPPSRIIKIPATDYLPSGKYPVLDQGKDLIVGYNNDETLIYPGELPVILFGDHTLCFKYVDFSFVIGADGTKVLVPNKSIVLPLYLYYALKSLKLESRGYARHYKYLRDREVLVPPISEQKRIASVLSRADELRQKRRQADELSGRFLQSLFIKTFGNPAENPKKWELQRLGDIATFVNGRAFKPSEWTEKGMPIIRIQNLNNPEAEYNYFDGEYENCHLVTQGDLLISWSATLDVFRWDKPPALLNQHIFKVVFDKCEINPDYFCYAVKNELEFMRNKTHGSTMKHITKKPFENTQIMFPPLSLQKMFAARVAEFEGFRKRQEEAGRKVELLFKSLMDGYFGG